MMTPRMIPPMSRNATGMRAASKAASSSVIGRELSYIGPEGKPFLQPIIYSHDDGHFIIHSRAHDSHSMIFIFMYAFHFF